MLSAQDVRAAREQQLEVEIESFIDAYGAQLDLIAEMCIDEISSRVDTRLTIGQISIEGLRMLKVVLVQKGFTASHYTFSGTPAPNEPIIYFLEQMEKPKLYTLVVGWRKVETSAEVLLEALDDYIIDVVSDMD